MTLEEIKNSIVKISVNSQFAGTGFFIAKDIVITNAHVIGNSTAEQILVNGQQCKGIITRKQDESGDYALLRTVFTAEYVPEINIQFKPAAADNTIGRFFGFGAESFNEPTAFEGKILNVYKGNMYELQVNPANRMVLPGDSGSPFVLDNAVTGLLFARKQQDNTKAFVYLFSDLKEIHHYIEKEYKQAQKEEVKEAARIIKNNYVDIKGNGNTVIQGVQAGTININTRGTTGEIKSLLKDFGVGQLSQLKKELAKLNAAQQDILSEITAQQRQKQEQEIENTEIKDFLNQMTQRQIQSTKKRLRDLEFLLFEYEDKLILEDDPRRKMRIEREIESLREQIQHEKNTLTNLTKEIS